MIQTRQFSTPPVVKNLLIINALFFMATELLSGGIGDTIINKLALFYWESPFFQPYQIITHMFLHANFAHFFTNMFALWMFGRILEYDLGSKRFLIFYMVCGIGAALLHMGVNWMEIVHIKNELASRPYDIEFHRALSLKVNISTVGASGAIFGILLGFGMLHPNSVIMLLFPPIPLKAKYFVIIYGLLELYLGVSGRAPGIAHFAHIGGMLWGFLLLWWWKRQSRRHRYQ